MASLAQHNADCRRFLGNDHDQVNRWMDEYFAIYGPSHRKVRHHREGVEEARHRFGTEGALAASVHILRDCRHIPRQSDYELGYVDQLGLKKEWSTTAYIKFTEEDFTNLVNQLIKPSGLILWSFINLETVRFFLLSLTKLTSEEVESLLPEWKKANEERQKLPAINLDAVSPLRRPADMSELPDKVREHIAKLGDSQLLAGIAAAYPNPEFAYVPISELISPLVYIDYEYLEELKPELAGDDDVDIVKFALPETIVTQIRAIADPTQRHITFISNQKTLSVSPLSVMQTPAGTEVKFTIANNISAILVSNFGGRLILRNGIHRAFLLAQLGHKEVPCVLVHETGPILNLQTSAYPSFGPPVLMQLRPPLLNDFLDKDLCLAAPLQRTHKMIQISANELIVPID